MIKIILSFITIYQSAFGNRLLLQIPALPAQPGVTPAGPPAVSAVPAPPANPAATTSPAAPAPPVQPVGPNSVPPAGPQPVPPAGPQPYPWQYPGAGIAPQPSQILECRVTPVQGMPATPGQCAGQVKNVMNAAENFEVACSVIGGCFESTINVMYGVGGVYVETIKGFFASENYALAGATINIMSQRSDQIYVEKLVCDKQYSCAGLTIVLGQNIVLESGAVFCGEATSCQGCMVKDGPLAQGIPCTEFI